jgi:hypothetical protein
MASYETGNQEFRAPLQSAVATGRSSLPRELTPARTRVHRRDENAPLPKASATACCSEAPRPTLPGIHEKKRMARLAGFPGSEARNVLTTMIRSTPTANIDFSNGRHVPREQGGSIVARGRHSQGGEHGVCAGQRLREGSLIGE